MTNTKLTCPECKKAVPLGCWYWLTNYDHVECPSCDVSLELVYRKGKGRLDILVRTLCLIVLILILLLFSSSLAWLILPLFAFLFIVSHVQRLVASRYVVGYRKRGIVAGQFYLSELLAFVLGIGGYALSWFAISSDLNVDETACGIGVAIYFVITAMQDLRRDRDRPVE